MPIINASIITATMTQRFSSGSICKDAESSIAFVNQLTGPAARNRPKYSAAQAINTRAL